MVKIDSVGRQAFVRRNIFVIGIMLQNSDSFFVQMTKDCFGHRRLTRAGSSGHPNNKGVHTSSLKSLRLQYTGMECKLQWRDRLLGDPCTAREKVPQECGLAFS